MRKRDSLAAAFLLACFALPACADIWECVDDVGNRRFTNIKSESKGCKLLNVGPTNVVSTGKPQAASKATPKDFPKVDGDTQRQRDAERRKILDQEMANEQKLLDQARKELSEQESQRFGSETNYQRVLDRLEPYKRKVKLHEDNVANLRRELTSAR
jgi:hypothetical protein